jgi:ParB family chromosome partitioning protein
LAAYELSFVEDSNIQQHIADYMEADGYRLDHKKAHLLREYFADGKLSERAIVQILSGEKTRKPKSNVSKPFQLKSSVVSQYFKQGQSKKEIEQIIEKALAQYFAGMQE